MREDEKLVTIAKFESGFDAELAKVTLENASTTAAAGATCWQIDGC